MNNIKETLNYYFLLLDDIMSLPYASMIIPPVLLCSLMGCKSMRSLEKKKKKEQYSCLQCILWLFSQQVPMGLAVCQLDTLENFN